MNANDAHEMIKINDQLVPVEMLSPELRRKWSIAQTRKVANEMATLMNEIQKELAAHLLLRAAPRQSVTLLGMPENDAAIRPLSAKAKEQADKEKRREGVKA